MKLSPRISIDHVALLHSVGSHHELLHLLVQSFSNELDEITRSLVQNELVRQDTSKPTCVISGVAIPHLLVDSTALDDTRVALGVIPGGCTMRDTKVYAAFMVLSPQRKQMQHARALARIARVFSKDDFIGKLRTAVSPQQAFEMVQSKDQAVL